MRGDAAPGEAGGRAAIDNERIGAAEREALAFAGNARDDPRHEVIGIFQSRRIGGINDKLTSVDLRAASGLQNGTRCGEQLYRTICARNARACLAATTSRDRSSNRQRRPAGCERDGTSIAAVTVACSGALTR